MTLNRPTSFAGARFRLPAQPASQQRLPFPEAAGELSRRNSEQAEEAVEAAREGTRHEQAEPPGAPGDS